MLTYEPSYILTKSNSGNITREKFTYKLHEFLKFGLGYLMAISKVGGLKKLRFSQKSIRPKTTDIYKYLCIFQIQYFLDLNVSALFAQPLCTKN